MYTAPEVFLAPLHLHDASCPPLPPLILLATGLTFVIGAGEIDLSFPGDHRLFRLRLRGAVQGIRPRLARGRRGGSPPGVLVGFINGLSSRKHRHSLVHRDARHAVLLVRHGDRAVRRQVLRVARRRGELACGNGSSGSLSAIRTRSRGRTQMSDAGVVDGDHRGVAVVRAQPPPLRRAHPVHRRFQRRRRASSASTSIARRSGSSR